MQHRVALLLICSFFLVCGDLTGQVPKIEFQPAVAGSVTAPLYVTSANDGTGRLFIVEQGGRIMVVPQLGAAATVFLDLTSKVLPGGERGLLGLAFHPDFASNHLFYVDYTRRSDGSIVVSQYTESTSNPNSADSGESVILTIPHPNTDHNGGSLQFGPDGYLYISVGDGGVQKDPQANAQNTSLLLGKILRIDVDRPDNGLAYGIPSDNPLEGRAGRAEIYAYGFRNPWRISFDRLTGQLYVADVGNDSFEEVDLVQAGGNYGWPIMEATTCTGYVPGCGNPSFIPPITQYFHTGRGGRCSISGGYVYRGERETFPLGAYIFGDYCTGEVLMLYEGNVQVLSDTAAAITSFGEDDSGELYMVGGSAYRMINTGGEFFPTVPFELTEDAGDTSLVTSGESSVPSIVHAQIAPGDSDRSVGAIAFIDFRQNGVLVSEAAVPATGLVERARIAVEIGSSVNTGLALANPDMINPAVLNCVFTDLDGNDVLSTKVTIPAGGQISALLTEYPFNGPASFDGSFTFESSVPIGVTALKSIVNERSEVLTTMLPVSDLDAGYTPAALVPHFAAGAGWTSEIILVDTTDDPLFGTIDVLSPTGDPEVILAEGESGNHFSYSIPPRSSRRLNLTNGDSGLKVGSVRVTPSTGMTAPAVSTLFLYAPSGVTISATGAAWLPPAKDIVMYADESESVQTALAVANASDEEILVDVRFNPRDTGVETKRTLAIPGRGQRVAFLPEILGLDNDAMQVSGVVTVSSSSPISVLGLRTQYNERGDFLMSTITSAIPREDKSQVSLPQLVDGGGYTTEIIVFPVDDSESNSGNIHFFNQNGMAVVLQFQEQ